MDKSTFEIVKAGLHWSVKMPKQIAPLALTIATRRAPVLTRAVPWTSNHGSMSSGEG